MDEEVSSDSWLMRPRFSRAVCYRPGSLVNVPVPSLSSILAPSKPTRACTGPPISVVHNASTLDPGYLPASHKTRESADLVSKVWNERYEEADTDFSFPSPFSSSIGRLSDCSISSKCTFDYFSPTRDEEGLRAVSPNSSSCSLGSVATYLSTTSSSICTDSFSERHSPKHLFGCRKNPGSESGSESGDPSEIRRVRSWSQYFTKSGGEKAVLSSAEWMVDLSQLLLGERFACGNHSRLYHGVYRGCPVAVKVIRQPEGDGTLSCRLEQIFTQEVTSLSGLQHPNVIRVSSHLLRAFRACLALSCFSVAVLICDLADLQFIAACKKPPVLCVITEYLSGGSLRSYLHKRDCRPLPASQIVRMALDIASGMEYLHINGVLHRDLKSENLVFSEDGSLKIVDFGVSCFESKCDYRAADPGTYRWMAPEMMQHKPYTRKVDVYSFGIVLWELVTTRLPYDDMSAVQAAFSVLNKNRRPPIPPDCPAILTYLMCQCWCTEPKERPEFWEILRTLTTFEQSLDGSNVTFPSPREGHSLLPGWLRRE